MEHHKLTALEKIFNRLFKTKINKIFEEDNFNGRILNISVSYEGQEEGWDDDEPEKDYKIFEVDVELSNVKFPSTIFDPLTFILLNMSEYILSGDYAIKVFYRNENNSDISHKTFQSDGFKYTDNEMVEEIKQELSRFILLRK